MRKFLFIILFIAFACRSFSQDYILFKDGEKIAVTLLTVADEYVRYYLFDDPSRKMYAKDIVRISKITFQDGRVLTYSASDVQDKLEYPVVPADNDKQARKQYTQSKPAAQAPVQTPGSDLLFLKNGQTLPVIVLEITPEIVKYREFDNPAGPAYSIYKSDVIKIILQNGKIETYTETAIETESAIETYTKIETETEDPKTDNKPLNRSDEYSYLDRYLANRQNSNRKDKDPLPREDSVRTETAPQKRYPVRFGIKGGVNFSTYSGLEKTLNLINDASGDRDMKNENKTGFFAGFVCQVNLLPDALFLQPELLVSLQGAQRSEGENSYTNDLYYLQFPVSLVYKINHY
jgi:hypothetical protein